MSRNIIAKGGGLNSDFDFPTETIVGADAGTDLDTIRVDKIIQNNNIVLLSNVVLGSYNVIKTKEPIIKNRVIVDPTIFGQELMPSIKNIVFTRIDTGVSSIFSKGQLASKDILCASIIGDRDKVLLCGDAVIGDWEYTEQDPDLRKITVPIDQLADSSSILTNIFKFNIDDKAIGVRVDEIVVWNQTPLRSQAVPDTQIKSGRVTLHPDCQRFNSGCPLSYPSCKLQHETCFLRMPDVYAKFTRGIERTDIIDFNEFYAASYEIVEDVTPPAPAPLNGVSLKFAEEVHDFPTMGYEISPNFKIALTGAFSDIYGRIALYSTPIGFMSLVNFTGYGNQEIIDPDTYTGWYSTGSKFFEYSDNIARVVVQVFIQQLYKKDQDGTISESGFRISEVFFNGETFSVSEKVLKTKSLSDGFFGYDVEFAILNSGIQIVVSTIKDDATQNDYGEIEVYSYTDLQQETDGTIGEATPLYTFESDEGQMGTSIRIMELEPTIHLEHGPATGPKPYRDNIALFSVQRKVGNLTNAIEMYSIDATTGVYTFLDLIDGGYSPKFGASFLYHTYNTDRISPKFQPLILTEMHSGDEDGVVSLAFNSTSGVYEMQDFYPGNYGKKQTFAMDTLMENGLNMQYSIDTAAKQYNFNELLPAVPVQQSGEILAGGGWGGDSVTLTFSAADFPNVNVELAFVAIEGPTSPTFIGTTIGEIIQIFIRMQSLILQQM